MKLNSCYSTKAPHNESLHFLSNNRRVQFEVKHHSFWTLTLAANLMGCIEQPHTGDSVVELHIDFLFH